MLEKDVMGKASREKFIKGPGCQGERLDLVLLIRSIL